MSSGEADPGAARRRPVALIILDGWGHAPPGPRNAISLARTPVWDGLVARYPWVLLRASGEAVGLPAGVMGNSEVGHLTIGSGRVFYQDLSRINRAIADGSFAQNPVLLEAFRAAAAGGGAVHLMGLLSDGGVHADLEHVKALVRLAKQQGVIRLYLHPFLDGRDTSPFHGIDLIGDLEAFLAAEGAGRIATVSGRYYAMDRDTRWDRTELRVRRPRRRRGAPGRRRGGGGAGVVRRGRHRRVRRADGRAPRARGSGPRRRHRPVLQLPARSCAAAHPRPHPARLRRVRSRPSRCAASGVRQHDRVRRDLRHAGRLPQGRTTPRAGRGRRACRSDAAPHRRDREVRPRDVLLQRGARAAVPGGASLSGPVAHRRGHLRPEARDELPRGGGEVPRDSSPRSPPTS